MVDTRHINEKGFIESFVRSSSTHKEKIVYIVYDLDDCRHEFTSAKAANALFPTAFDEKIDYDKRNNPNQYD